MALVRAVSLWLSRDVEWLVTLVALAVALEIVRLELLQRYCQKRRGRRIIGEDGTQPSTREREE
jgi:hypothetical protein